MNERDGPRISPLWLIAPALLIVSNVVLLNTASTTSTRNGVYRPSVVAGALVSAAVFGGYALVAARASRVPVREALALRRPRPRSRPGLLVAGAVVGISAVSLALEPFLHGDRDQGLTPTRGPHGGEWATLAAALVVLGVVVPLCEELLFRGLGFAALGRYAVPGSAIGFALAHGLLALIVPVLVAGIVLAELRRRTASLWPVVATHATINLVGIVLALLTV
ncbi:MAG TPA: CPBP family intramembrane glutamic endopeptidase [Gaiellales bacterium]